MEDKLNKYVFKLFMKNSENLKFKYVKYHSGYEKPMIMINYENFIDAQNFYNIFRIYLQQMWTSTSRKKRKELYYCIDKDFINKYSLLAKRKEILNKWKD